MRRVTTRVFPVPAPARTRSGPSVQLTAFAWASLSPSKMVDSNRDASERNLLSERPCHADSRPSAWPGVEASTRAMVWRTGRTPRGSMIASQRGGSHPPGRSPQSTPQGQRAEHRLKYEHPDVKVKDLQRLLGISPGEDADYEKERFHPRSCHEKPRPSLDDRPRGRPRGDRLAKYHPTDMQLAQSGPGSGFRHVVRINNVTRNQYALIDLDRLLPVQELDKYRPACGYWRPFPPPFRRKGVPARHLA